MKVTIVGLDGASPNIFEQWLERLPNIRAVLDSGYSGLLESTDPPVTNVAWTSFATGKRPEKTGIFDWVYVDEGYVPRTYRGDEVRQKSLYDLVDGSTFVNLPASYPRTAAADGAHVVHAFDAPDRHAAVPDAFQSFPEFDAYENGKPDDELTPIEQVRQLRDIEAMRFSFAKRAFEETDELFFVLFSSTDFGLHIIQELEGEIAREFRSLYEDIDGYIGWFRERSDNLVVMSDHGFEEKTRQFFVSEWLRENGYLTLAEPDASGTGRLQSLVPEAVLQNDTLYGLAKRAFQHLSFITRLADDEEVYAALADPGFDYDETSLFKTGGLWNLVVNRAGVFERGTVDDDEARALVDEVTERLSAVRDSETGEPVFDYVRPASDERLRNPRAPDVLLNPTAGTSIAGLSARRKVFEASQTHAHRKDGFFVLAGESFAPGQGDATIVDVMPTVLHALGRPVPIDVDGTVLGDAFRTGGEVNTAEPAVFDDAPPVRERVAGDDEVLQRRLEELGYL